MEKNKNKLFKISVAVLAISLILVIAILHTPKALSIVNTNETMNKTTTLVTSFGPLLCKQMTKEQCGVQCITTDRVFDCLTNVMYRP